MSTPVAGNPTDPVRIQKLCQLCDEQFSRYGIDVTYLAERNAVVFELRPASGIIELTPTALCVPVPMVYQFVGFLMQQLVGITIPAQLAGTPS